ncbi:MAG: transposase [Verrucomicrobiota bacterium]
MRQPRLVPDGSYRVHAISRIVGKEKIFGSNEKEVVRAILKKTAKFLEVRILSYAIMSNHVHILLEIPDRDDLSPLTEESLLASLSEHYSRDYVIEVEQQFERARKQSRKPETLQRRIEEILAPFEKRRGNLSIFMKEFKQKVSVYINKTHGRVGTLWEGRFKSVLVGDDEQSLLTMAGYIDLNAMRAGIVDKPEDYRWCSYAEALAGDSDAREGLQAMMKTRFDDTRFEECWERTQARYRQFLYEEGVEVQGDKDLGQRDRLGMSQEKVESVIEQQGEISIASLLRHRVRYFTDGFILGTERFVNETFERHRASLTSQGSKRTSGARKLRGANWGQLRVYRDLQKE